MIRFRRLLSHLPVAGTLLTGTALCVTFSACGFEDPEPSSSASRPLQSAPIGASTAPIGSNGVQQVDTSNVSVPTALMAAPEESDVINIAPPAPVSTEAPVDCGADSQSAGIKPVVLVFAFDVSASMGDGSQYCFDRTLKWEPVVAAAKTFFADPASAGLSAALTFFPAADPGASPSNPTMGGGQINQALCQGATYETPDVPVTALPSTAFATALDAVTPAADAAWRLGTPTGPALEGTIAQIAALKTAQPDNNYIIVLVTDGAPALCDANTDSVQNVAGILSDAAANNIPTYVIGVDNPPEPAAPSVPSMPSSSAAPGFPPMGGGQINTLCVPLADNLDALANGGGTGSALIVDTGNPLQTSADFKAIIDQIRDENLNCEVSIPPPPPGKAFDKAKVNVSFVDTSGATHDLVYDQTCAVPESWRYDNEAAPTVIQLCESTCTSVQADIKAELNIAFGCETRANQQ